MIADGLDRTSVAEGIDPSVNGRLTPNLRRGGEDLGEGCISAGKEEIAKIGGAFEISSTRIYLGKRDRLTCDMLVTVENWK